MRNFDMNRKKLKKKGISIIEQVYYYNFQALIFATLAAAYIGESMEGHH